MTDLDLLLYGVVITWIAAAGAYVYIRERFTMAEYRAEKRRAALAEARDRQRYDDAA